MKRPQKRTITLFVLAVVLFVIGCESAPQVMSSNPDQQMNPAMSAHQKAIRLGHNQQQSQN
jgi:starvation-inducible outer membrane lipoprotein